LLEQGLGDHPRDDKVHQIDRVPMNVLHLVVDPDRISASP
jgi:hypothetical protein